MLKELNKTRNELYKKYLKDEIPYSDFKEVDKKLNKALIKEYPFLQRKDVLTGDTIGNQDYSFCIFKDDIPFGWWQRWGLAFLEDLNEVLKKHNYVDKFYIMQVKEKYGSLRFYTWEMLDEWRSHEWAWEYISAHTCINCGEFPVPMRTTSWVSPWCDSCFKEKNKKELIDKYTVKNDDIICKQITRVFGNINTTTYNIDMIPYYEKIGYKWGEKDDVKRRKAITG